MGCFTRRKTQKPKVLASAPKSASEKIDQQLKVSGLKDSLNIKFLILGSGESGKSTVLKQIKLINKIALTVDELRTIVTSLRRNSIQCMKILVEQVGTFGYPLGPQEKEYAGKLDELDLDDLGELNLDASNWVKDLWACESIKKAYGRKSEFWILEAADYFFTNVERFIEPDFAPSEEDIVMARVMTIGIIKTDLSYPPLQITLVDVGGQRNERRKWIHCFDNVNGIIFLCNLAGYNTVLFEDASVNRMVECFNLFKQTVNNPAFEKTPFYLLFNKKDMFEEKLRTDPITNCECFANYSGSDDTAEIMRYIETAFREQIQCGDPKRLMTFSIAARFKRDVKVCWDDVISDVRLRYKTQISSAVKQLSISPDSPVEN